MILPCGCDSIFTRFADLCDACQDRAVRYADEKIKREKENPESSWRKQHDQSPRGGRLRPGS